MTSCRSPLGSVLLSVALFTLAPVSGAEFGDLNFSGQGRWHWHEQSGPTLSPYLNMLDDELGGLPNYNLLVRPQLEEREWLGSQARNLDQLDRQIQSLPAEPARLHSAHRTWNPGPRWPISSWTNTVPDAFYYRPASRYMVLPHYYQPRDMSTNLPALDLTPLEIVD